MAVECLRCAGVALEVLSPADTVDFFRCPRCEREYARVAGRELTDRWMSPISLVLYPIIFSRRAQEEADRVVTSYLNGGCVAETPEQLMVLVDEIRAELARPTQRVRDILPLPSTEDEVSEADLREFLRRFADGMEAALRDRQAH